MEQLSDGLPLQNEKMATPFRNNTKSEECGIFCFRGYVRNIFASNAHQAQLIKIFVKVMDEESDGFVYLRQKISQNE